MDETGFLHFTAHQQLDKALHTLDGLLSGISLDGCIGPAEAKELANWCDGFSRYAKRHPFNEILPRVRQALADGVLSPEELEDLRWLCSKLTKENPYWNAVTSDLQRLQGLLHGITADGVISAEELSKLQEWMQENEHLAGCFPYDELTTVVAAVLKDGRIDAAEHEQLMRHFNSFIAVSMAKQVKQLRSAAASKKEMGLPAVCATCPTIHFPDRAFCFTGFSSRGLRSDFALAVTELRGNYVDKVDGGLSYLIVGAMGNPAWAFCCYGRKVEQAMELRKKGRPLLIVHENDFWDAYQDIKAGVV